MWTFRLMLLRDSLVRPASEARCSEIVDAVEPAALANGTELDTRRLAPIRNGKILIARATGQKVAPRRFRLKERLYALRQAVGADVVGWLAERVVWLEGIESSTASGLDKLIARRILLKTIPLLEVLLKRQERLAYLHLCNLGVEHMVHQLEDELLRSGDINFRATKHLLEVLANFRRTEQVPGNGSHGTEDRGDVRHE